MTSVFNPLVLSESNNVLSSFDTSLDDISEKGKSSFFRESLNYILESQREFNEANKQFYRAVVESGCRDEEVVHEAFGSFFGAIKTIIDKFLRFIKSLFDKFILLINSFIRREKYIINHKSDLNKFSSIHEFRMTGFDFTFSPDIPVVDAEASFSTGFAFNAGGSNDAIGMPSNLNALKDSVQALNNALNGDWYDQFRGRVLGRDNTAIYQSDFADELFCVFRNQMSSPEDFDVTSTVVTQSYSRFEHSDKAISTVKSTKSKLENQYNTIKKQIDRMMSINYTDGNRAAHVSLDTAARALTGEEITQMDLFIKAKTNQVQEMSNIHAMAFAAKLDALTDCFKQDKGLLYRALSKVTGSLGKEA